VNAVNAAHEGSGPEEQAFIVPPPGLVPDTPAPPPNTTVRPKARPVERELPSFAPPGASGVVLGGPAVAGVPALPPVLVPPVAPAAPVTPTAPPAPVVSDGWLLTGQGGFEARITGRTVVGRAPEATAFTGADAVVVTDPERTVSKTHAILEPSGDALVVTDLRSTNGVRVEREGAAPRELAAGASARLMPGDQLVLGEFRLRVGV
jgi:hypothetical protein